MSDYANPLVTRYASHDMSEIFSEEEKIVLWRRLWVALAESEKELGLGITDRQIEELKQNVTNLDRKSTRLNSSHRSQSRMPSSA